MHVTISPHHLFNPFTELRAGVLALCASFSLPVSCSTTRPSGCRMRSPPHCWGWSLWKRRSTMHSGKSMHRDKGFFWVFMVVMSWTASSFPTFIYSSGVASCGCDGIKWLLSHLYSRPVVLWHFQSPLDENIAKSQWMQEYFTFRVSGENSSLSEL